MGWGIGSGGLVCHSIGAVGLVSSHPIKSIHWHDSNIHTTWSSTNATCYYAMIYAIASHRLNGIDFRLPLLLT